MDKSFGKMICDGKIIDLDKTESKELEDMIGNLENQQEKKRNELKKLLEKISEEM